MKLPRQIPWDKANQLWASQLDPILAEPILAGQQRDGIVLAKTTPLVISHSLGRVPTGWFVVDNTADVTIWRTAWTNNSITLESSDVTTISIWVY